MNWSIHGSGFASVRGLDTEGIDLTFSLSHLRISHLALMATGMIAQALQLHQDVSERAYQLAGALANRFREA